MKEVFAVIRQNMINQTKDALRDSGFPSMTCSKVMGRGKKQIAIQIINALSSAAESPESIALSQIADAYRLLPKRFINIIVKDEEVEKIVKVIIDANSTGQAGDGKIFIMPVNEVYRIRTGESGESAV
ncbi:MAG: P-II family nitrogen regulator [Endomicrobium sp.]|jgi:nitrogen regulatory protein PII 2|nr:P-II family nitrogen regulator [Endomicrobium sp.]